MACLRLSWLFAVLLVLVETHGLCPTSGNVGSITFSPGPTVAPLIGGAAGVWTTTATYVSLIADGSTILTPTISSDSADAVLNVVGTTYILTMLEEGTIYLHVTNGVTVDACVEIRVIAGATPYLINAGFETGDLTAWTLYGDVDAVHVQPRLPIDGQLGYYAHFGPGDVTMVGQLKGLFPGYRYVVTFDRADGNANTFNFEITVGTTPVVGGGASTGETFRQFISAPFVANALEMPIYIRAVTKEYELPGRKKRGPVSEGWAVDNILIQLCSGCGDPHFVGLDGAIYDFHGKAERIFALVSDSRVAANSLFVDMSKKPIEATAIGSTCFRVCNDVAILHPNGTVLVNGKQKNLLGGIIRIAPKFEIRPFGRKAAEVLFGNWSVIMSFRYNHHFDMVKMTHTAPDDRNIHGVYGMSGRPEHHQTDKKKCFKKQEGGCELLGQPKDYALPVDADLCSTQWTYSQFSSRMCQ